MSDDHDDISLKRHWQSLAEEFGLPPDPKSEPASVKAEAPPPPPPRRVEVAPPPPPPEPMAPRAELEAAEPAFEPEIETAEPLNLEHISLDHDDTGQPPAEEPRPKRGGGRRRRPRQDEDRRPDEAPPPGTAPRAVEEAEEGPSVSEKPAEESEQEEGRSRRRKRSRRGKKGTTAEGEAAPAKSEASRGEPAAAVADEDDEEAEARSISTWNLPSWQELIASLYRPDR